MDDNNIKRTHTSKNETCQHETTREIHHRCKQQKKENCNEVFAEHLSLSPSLSYNSASGNSYDSKNNNNNEGCNIKAICSHLQCDGKCKKANTVCVINDSVSISSTSVDMSIPKRQKPPNREKNGRPGEGLTDINCANTFANSVTKRNNGSSSSSSGDGRDNIVSTTKFMDDPKNKKNNCSLSKGATGERGRTMNSSTRSSTELRARKIRGANNLSNSNSTLTNVNIPKNSFHMEHMSAT